MTLQAVFSTGKIHSGGSVFQDSAVLHNLAAPEPDRADAACGDKALIGRVAGLGNAVLAANHMAVAGIIDHNITVAAGGQNALAGIETVQLCGIFAENSAHLRKRQLFAATP